MLLSHPDQTGSLNKRDLFNLSGRHFRPKLSKLLNPHARCMPETRFNRPTYSMVRVQQAGTKIYTQFHK